MDRGVRLHVERNVNYARTSVQRTKTTKSLSLFFLMKLRIVLDTSNRPAIISRFCVLQVLACPYEAGIVAANIRTRILVSIERVSNRYVAQKRE